MKCERCMSIGKDWIEATWVNKVNPKRIWRCICGDCYLLIQISQVGYAHEYTRITFGDRMAGIVK